jgi:hypothetical protein
LRDALQLDGNELLIRRDELIIITLEPLLNLTLAPLRMERLLSETSLKPSLSGAELGVAAMDDVAGTGAGFGEAFCSVGMTTTGSTFTAASLAFLAIV